MRDPARPTGGDGGQPSLGARSRRDPVLLGLAAVTVAIMGFYATPVGGTPLGVVLFWLAQPALDLMLYAISRSIARTPDLPRPMRRFWIALSYAGLIFTVGDGYQTLAVSAHPGMAGAVPGAVQSVCFVVGVCWVAWVMLTYPLAVSTGRERLRFWMDSATVLVAAGVFAWTVTVRPSLGGNNIGELVELLVGNALLITAAFACAKLVLSGNAPVTRAAATPAVIGILFQGVLTSLTPANLDSRYFGLMLGVRLLPSVLIVIGPRLQELQLRGNAETVLRRPAKRFSRLPYVMVAGTYIMLFLVLPHRLDLRAVGVLVGVVLISVIVVGRQLMAFTDNAVLLEQLDLSLHDLRRQEERFRSLVQHASDVTTVIDPTGVMTYISPSIQRTLGYRPETVIGRPVLSLLHPDDLAELRDQFAELLAVSGKSVTHQARYRHADGSWRWLEVINTNLIHEPSVAGIVSNAREVTETRQLHDQLRYQASHDGLTGLANRRLFTEQLAAASGRNRRDDGPVAIMLIDLDGFKTVNDTLGHHVGDAVLAAVADRLRDCVRAGDTASRLGGDEFAILLPGADAAAASLVARRFLALLEQPIAADGRMLHIHASVGIVAGLPGDPDALLRRADSAMYEAKRAGKNRYVCAVAAPARPA